jgi:hypothetical protein
MAPAAAGGFSPRRSVASRMSCAATGRKTSELRSTALLDLNCSMSAAFSWMTPASTVLPSSSSSALSCFCASMSTPSLSSSRFSSVSDAARGS